jgi:hypothetical protein
LKAPYLLPDGSDRDVRVKRTASRLADAWGRSLVFKSRAGLTIVPEAAGRGTDQDPLRLPGADRERLIAHARLVAALEKRSRIVIETDDEERITLEPFAGDGSEAHPFVALPEQTRESFIAMLDHQRTELCLGVVCGRFDDELLMRFPVPGSGTVDDPFRFEVRDPEVVHATLAKAAAALGRTVFGRPGAETSPFWVAGPARLGQEELERISRVLGRPVLSGPGTLRDPIRVAGGRPSERYVMFPTINGPIEGIPADKLKPRYAIENGMLCAIAANEGGGHSTETLEALATIAFALASAGISHALTSLGTPVIAGAKGRGTRLEPFSKVCQSRRDLDAFLESLQTVANLKGSPVTFKAPPKPFGTAAWPFEADQLCPVSPKDPR